MPYFPNRIGDVSTLKVATPPVFGSEEREGSSRADTSCCVGAEAMTVVAGGEKTAKSVC